MYDDPMAKFEEVEKLAGAKTATALLGGAHRVGVSAVGRGAKLGNAQRKGLVTEGEVAEQTFRGSAVHNTARTVAANPVTTGVVAAGTVGGAKATKEIYEGTQRKRVNKSAMDKFEEAEQVEKFAGTKLLARGAARTGSKLADIAEDAGHNAPKVERAGTKWSTPKTVKGVSADTALRGAAYTAKNPGAVMVGGGVAAAAGGADVYNHRKKNR